MFYSKHDVDIVNMFSDYTQLLTKIITECRLVVY